MKKKIIFLIIFIVMIILTFILGQYLLYSKKIEIFKRKEQKKIIIKEVVKKENIKNYSGFYYGCTNNTEHGGELCIELVLNKDNTVFISDPYVGKGYVGSFKVEDDKLLINTIYNISTVDPGIENHSFELSINENEFNYKDLDKNVSITLTSQDEDVLTLYKQMKVTKE